MSNGDREKLFGTVLRNSMQPQVRFFLLLIACIGGAGVARAQTEAIPQTERESAREAAESGRREYNLGHWQPAIDAFETSYKLSGDPALLFNLAQAYRRLGNGTEALKLYHAFLREKPDDPNGDVAQKQIDDLKAQNWHDPFVETPPSGGRSPKGLPSAPTPAPPTPTVGLPPPAVVSPALPSPPAIVEAPWPRREASHSEPPLYARWWVWAIAGAVVAGTATVFILTRSANDPDCLGINPCGSVH